MSKMKYKIGDTFETPDVGWLKGVFVIISVNPHIHRPYGVQKVSGDVKDFAHQDEDQLDKCRLVGTTGDGVISTASESTFIEWEDE